MFIVHLLLAASLGAMAGERMWSFRRIMLAWFLVWAASVAVLGFAGVVS